MNSVELYDARKNLIEYLDNLYENGYIDVDIRLKIGEYLKIIYNEIEIGLEQYYKESLSS